jgi:hypothetical protein
MTAAKKVAEARARVWVVFEPFALVSRAEHSAALDAYAAAVREEAVGPAIARLEVGLRNGAEKYAARGALEMLKKARDKK